MCTKESKLPV